MQERAGRRGYRNPSLFTASTRPSHAISETSLWGKSGLCPIPRRHLRLLTMAPSQLGQSVRAIRPRAGMPHMRRYDDGRLSSRFTDISKALQSAGHPAGEVSERELSRLTGRLLFFYDSTLGYDSPAEGRTLTRLPARFFHDYEADGALMIIIDTCLRFKATAGWASLDFPDSGRREKHLEMLSSVDRALRAAKKLSIFSVYLAPTLPADQVETLRSLSLSHGGVVVSLPDVATHIVYPDPPGTNENMTDSQVMLRILKKDGKPGGTRALVHWFHHPDSYDEWIFAKEVAGVVEPEPPTRVGPWHVQARWVRDMHLFNEWMNELDYEMPDSFLNYIGTPPPHVAEARLAAERAGGGRKFSVRLRLRMPDDVGYGPAAKRMRASSDRVTMVGLPSIGIAGADRQNTRGKKSMDVEDFRKEALPEGNMRSAGLEPAASLTQETVHSKPLLPTHSDWFDAKRVNAIERRALPEFFDGSSPSKTTKIYMEMRNFLIQTWARTPGKYLTATAARRNFRGDACAIHRIHSFLEHWGLINFNVNPETKPQAVFVPPPPALPVRAGRTDPAMGGRRTILFLDDGSPADVHEGRVRRVRIDGIPIGFRETESQPVDAIAAAGLDTFTQGDSTLSPGAATAYEGQASGMFQTPTSKMQRAGFRASREQRTAGLSSRPVRSTRYSSRRRRAYKYTEDDSSDGDALSNATGAEQETEEVPAANSDGSESGGDGASREENDKDVGDVEYHCDICGQDCTKIRYHCTTHADMDSCENCFKGGKYPAPLQARDFILMTSVPQGPDTSGAHPGDPLVWSETETLLLLEALEMYGDCWEMVAEHVESKDITQCILQFLRLPIEESFLEHLRSEWWAKPGVLSGNSGQGEVDSSAGIAIGPRSGVAANGVSAMSPAALLQCSGAAHKPMLDFPSLTGKPLVFADRVNTVTSQVALLSSLVPPGSVDQVLTEMWAKHQPNSDFPKPATGASNDVRKFITDECYSKVNSEVPLASDIAATDLGLLTAKHALSFALGEKRHAGQSIEEAFEAAKNRAMNLDETGASRDPGTDAADAAEKKEASGSGQENARKGPSLDFWTTQSAAITALVSAALRAKGLLATGDEELGRLHAMIFEVKLSMIKMKIDHLKSIEGHAILSSSYSKRERHEGFGTQCLMTERMLKEQPPLDSASVFAVPAEESNYKAPLDMQGLFACPTSSNDDGREFVAQLPSRSVALSSGHFSPSVPVPFERLAGPSEAALGGSRGSFAPVYSNAGSAPVPPSASDLMSRPGINGGTPAWQRRAESEHPARIVSGANASHNVAAGAASQAVGKNGKDMRVSDVAAENGEKTGSVKLSAVGNTGSKSVAGSGIAGTARPHSKAIHADVKDPSQAADSCKVPEGESFDSSEAPRGGSMSPSMSKRVDTTPAPSPVIDDVSEGPLPDTSAGEAGLGAKTHKLQSSAGGGLEVSAENGPVADEKLNGFELRKVEKINSAGVMARKETPANLGVNGNSSTVGASANPLVVQNIESPQENGGEQLSNTLSGCRGNRAHAKSGMATSASAPGSSCGPDGSLERDCASEAAPDVAHPVSNGVP